MAAIELAPMSTGELLDRTFSYYREHFLLFVGIMAPPQAAIVGVSLLIQSLHLISPLRPTQDPSQVFAQLPAVITGFVIGFGVMMLAYVAIYSVAHGATAYALSEVYLGRSTSITDAYRNLRGKVWRLFDVVFSIIVRIIGIYLLCTIAAVLIALIPLTIIGLLGGRSPMLAVVFGLLMGLGVVAAFLLAPVLMMRYAVAMPALVLENLNARDAMKRSVFLAKGNLWRIFLTFLLMYLVALVVMAIFQGPFLVAMVVIGANMGAAPFWLQVPMTISSGIGGALAGPLIVIALTLLYYDARVRKEGFDLQHMMANLNEVSIGAVTPPAIVPAAPLV